MLQRKSLGIETVMKSRPGLWRLWIGELGGQNFILSKYLSRQENN
jgi:hypothetical protein